jgi:hypothetical protein
MGALGNYYIDAENFEDATAVYTDVNLTTCAADDYYSNNVIIREQVGCVLLPMETCPSCPGPTPSDGPTLTPTQTATGEPYTEPAVKPKYYRVLSCPLTGGSSGYYTNKAPTLANQRYVLPGTEYTENGLLEVGEKFVWDNSDSTTNPTDLPVNNLIEPVSAQECPAVAATYTYWDLQNCETSATMRARQPSSSVDLLVDTAVSVTGVAGCWRVLGSTTLSTTNEVNVSFPECAACLPVVPVYVSFNVTQAGKPDNLVTIDSQYQTGDSVVTDISGGGCWLLGSQSTVTTSNTITSACPETFACYRYTLTAAAAGDETFTIKKCGETSTTDIVVPAGSSTSGGCIVYNEISISPGNPGSGFTEAGWCTAPSGPVGNTYYNLLDCSSSATIVAGYPGVATFVPYQNAVKIKTSSTCYLVTGVTNTTSVNEIEHFYGYVPGYEGSTPCLTCNPAAGCYRVTGIKYSASTPCAGSPGEVFLNNTTLAGSTQVFGTGGCATNEAPALNGYYSQGTLSKYWNGFTFTTESTTCDDTPDPGPDWYYYTAKECSGAPTIELKNANALEIGQAVILDGGETCYEITGTLTTSSTTNLVDQSKIYSTCTECLPTSGNNYLVLSCDTTTLYSMSSVSTTLYAVNEVLRFTHTATGEILCGTIEEVNPVSFTADSVIIERVNFGGCDDPLCLGVGEML